MEFQEPKLLAAAPPIPISLVAKIGSPRSRGELISATKAPPEAAETLNSFLSHLSQESEGRAWAASVERCDENRRAQERECIRLAIGALSDQDGRVRTEAISVLTVRAAYEADLRRSMANYPRRRESMDERTKQMHDSVGWVDPALPLVKKMAAADSDPGVRAEAQKFLSNFASQQGVARDVVASLADPEVGVRTEALKALKSSHEPTPMATIEKAFASAKGDVALGLIELFQEREDSALAARLTPGFEERSAAERLMILTAIAGHTDDAAVSLVVLGLKDRDKDVRRAALMRLLEFPSQEAVSAIKSSSAGQLADVETAVQKELGSRELFPFLGRRDSSARETIFPSVEGTGPMVSPDGKWVAYVETGWGRPGGSGGTGRSNLLSIVHVVRRDGSEDRLVSDMFLVGWMSDSRSIGSARDGFASIVNLSGKIVAEFGEVPVDPSSGRSQLNWLDNGTIIFDRLDRATGIRLLERFHSGDCYQRFEKLESCGPRQIARSCPGECRMKPMWPVLIERRSGQHLCSRHRLRLTTFAGYCWHGLDASRCKEVPSPRRMAE